MSDGLGLRIVRRIDRPPRASFEALLKVTTGNACDAMDRGGAMDWRIKPIDPSFKAAGTAVTVKARPCDNLIVYKALEIAEPGDVIVIAIGGYTGAATWGDLTSLIAKQKGLAGMVTDGLVRDTGGMREVGLPAWAAGAVPSGPFKDGPGEVNVPVCCGGVVVRPGDVIFGDVDGVVVIPAERAAAVTAAALAVDASEAQKVRDVEAGRLIPDYVDKRLRELGYEV